MKELFSLAFKEPLLLSHQHTIKFAFSAIAFSIGIYCVTALPVTASTNEPTASSTAEKSEQKNNAPATLLDGRTKKVALTDNEKQIAHKLGFDESVLLLIKERLNPEMGIVISGGLEPQDLTFLEANLNEPLQLLEKDAKNYVALEAKHPELKPIIDWETRHFDNRIFNHQESANYEKQEQDRLGVEKFARQKKYNAAAEPYQALIAEAMQPEIDALQKQRKGMSIVRSIDTSAFISSDEALAAAIADLHKKYDGKVLREENKAKVQLALKYFGVGDHHYGDDSRMPALRSELEKLNYRISDQNSHFKIRKAFETKAEAEKFLEESGTAVDSLSLSRQEPRQFKAIYPVDFDKDFSNIETAKTIINQSMSLGAENPAMNELVKVLLTAPVQSRKEALGLILRIPPGSTVTNEAERHWLITVPERFDATVRLRTATVFKLPAQGSGFELVEAQGTNGTNYGLDTKAIINKLKYWDKKYGVTVTEASRDSVKIRFRNLPDDISELCTECFLFCPDIELSPNEHDNAARLRQLATTIKETKQMSFWWD
ncbi:hypothetical protein BH11CYA1_BH11CYA1_44720 [soil metagenome]